MRIAPSHTSPNQPGCQSQAARREKTKLMQSLHLPQHQSLLILTRDDEEQDALLMTQGT